LIDVVYSTACIQNVETKSQHSVIDLIYMKYPCLKTADCGIPLPAAMKHVAIGKTDVCAGEKS